MARIIYKKGCESQNRLESIDGIEIELLNGQKALIYPKYAKKELLRKEVIAHWEAKNVTEIEALKETDNVWATVVLARRGSPAANFVEKFRSEKHGIFGLPTLLAAMEVQDQKEDIDALAGTIEGADLLRNFLGDVWSCSRQHSTGAWVAVGSNGLSGCYNLSLGHQFLCIPLVLYR